MRLLRLSRATRIDLPRARGPAPYDFSLMDGQSPTVKIQPGSGLRRALCRNCLAWSNADARHVDSLIPRPDVSGPAEYSAGRIGAAILVVYSGNRPKCAPVGGCRFQSRPAEALRTFRHLPVLDKSLRRVSAGSAP